MPFVLIIVGIFLFVSAIRGTTGQLATLVKGDFASSGTTHSFLYWFVSILVIGAIGYVPALKKLSDAFLVLVILSLAIANKGFFAQFNSALQQIASMNYGSASNPGSTTNLSSISGLLPNLGTQTTGGSLLNSSGNIFGTAESFNAANTPNLAGDSASLGLFPGVTQ